MPEGLDDDESVIIDPPDEDADANEKDPEVTEVGSKDDDTESDLGM